MLSTFMGHVVRQVAYFVPDVREAALCHSRLFGSGPYFVSPPISPKCVLRGVPQPVDMTIAIGQWGSQMVEFVQQNNTAPSIFRELYPEGSGRFGIHHLAVIADNAAEVVAQLGQAGYPIAAKFRPPEEFDVYFCDAIRDFGHYVEVYPGVPAILGPYAFVAEAAIGFDGTNPVRDMPAA